MLDNILSRIFTSQWMVIFFTIAILLLAAEAGYLSGVRLYRNKDEARRGQIGGIQGAILGLLGLLLGFTFAMSVGRYETRRALVLQEANAIGTTYLRASLLPQAQKSSLEDLLKRYLEVRLKFYEAGDDGMKQLEAEQQAAAIQREMWDQAVAAAKETPTPLVTSFITSLNEVIDLDATRMNALRTHVPGAVWLLVLCVAVVGCFASGYSSGASGARSKFTNIILPSLIAIAITLVADLDRPRGGLIGIKQQPLIDLRQSLMADEEISSRSQ